MTPEQVARMYQHAATEAMSPHLTKDEMALRRVLRSLARAASEIARETRVTPPDLSDVGLREAEWGPIAGNAGAVGLDHGGERSYLPRDRPDPGRATARLELVTAFGAIDLDFADIKVTPGDTVRVTATDSAGTWVGTADNFDGAILAMLADRCGYHADITRKADWGR
jgi:hypothetical protein